jgi:hypothetical protein
VPDQHRNGSIEIALSRGRVIAFELPFTRTNLQRFVENFPILCWDPMRVAWKKNIATEAGFLKAAVIEGLQGQTLDASLEVDVIEDAPKQWCDRRTIG